MARPRLGERSLVKFSITVDPAMLERIDALVERRQAQLPFGRLERSEVCRELLTRGLAQVEAEEQPRPKRTARKGTTTAAD